MKKHLIAGIAIALLLGCMEACDRKKADSISTIEEHFRAIPDSQPLAVYWYWIGGNMSKEGVVKDLQAMKEAGINRVQIGMIGADQGAPQGPVRLFTDEWWKILHQMFITAGELDIEVGLFNCPGWSQSGGPWVAPSQSMRYLAYVKDTISGPCRAETKLSSLGEDAQDVKVLAYPLIRPNVAFQQQGELATDTVFYFVSPTTAIVRSIVIDPIEQSVNTEAELSVKENGTYRNIAKFPIDRSNVSIIVGFKPFSPIAVALPEMKGDTFRLTMAQAGVIKKITLSDLPVVHRYPEKTLAKMWQTPHPMWDAYMWPEAMSYEDAPVMNQDEVIDISDQIQADGSLAWDVPDGEWVIMRTAMLPTGTKDAPAPEEGQGLETDKMSKKHIRAHFDHYIGQILERIPAEDRKTFRVVVEDSYETGGQNWTDDMIDDFHKKYGYDPVPFLPVFSGVVVGSADMSDHFLWDVRRLIADEISYNYVGGLREVSHEHGLTTWLENYGHWGFPGEFLQYGAQSDEIAGEFWSFGDLGDIENRVASSCGHIYGKDKVWAESFTCGGPDFTQYPGQMKQRGDRFFAEGINATLLHLYIQQPDDRVPGINAWFGNEFNRNNTWFSQMDVFAAYLKRCNYMLQQGRYVADVAYFIGEDVPKMTGICNPELPRGYSFDYVNAEVLEQAMVRSGKLVLKSGMEYSVLVLPKINTMRPELLKKLQALVRAGLVMVGPAPDRSPSLERYPMADQEVKTMAAEMWQPENGKKYATYGKGRIYPDASLEEIFSDLRILPDFSTEQALPLLFIHKALPDADIYFVTNQGDQPIDFTASFRITGSPELWNPLTEEVRLLPEYKQAQDSGTTFVPLSLQPFESSFIVYRKNGNAEKPEGKNYPDPIYEQTIDSPWKVYFLNEQCGVENPVMYSSLQDWTESEDKHVRYYSGTANYQTAFSLDEQPKGQVYLDLGKVMVMAKVVVNGHYVGGVWTPPYRVNVTEVLKQGDNTLEIMVVNNWRNRLIGEKNLPEEERFTFQTATYLNKDSELQSSGLLGPVRLLGYDIETKTPNRIYLDR